MQKKMFNDKSTQKRNYDYYYLGLPKVYGFK